MPDHDFERLVKGAHVSISPMTATNRGSSVSKTISSKAASRSSVLGGGSAGGASGAGSAAGAAAASAGAGAAAGGSAAAGAASPGEAGVAGSVVAGSLMAVSPKGGCGKLYACLTRRCRRCLRRRRGRGFGQLCAHGVHPGMKIACQDRVDLADRVAHDGAEKCRGRGVAEVDVAQERGEGEEEKPACLNQRNGMRDHVFTRGPALERGLRLQRVDRGRDVGELAMPLKCLQARLKGWRRIAHLPGGCARRAISMQRSANFSIIAVRCVIWPFRNHMTMPRKRMLISTSSRNAGGRAPISLSLVRAIWAITPCCCSSSAVMLLFFAATALKVRQGGKP